LVETKLDASYLKHRETTVSDKEYGLEAGTRYRESGLVHWPNSEAQVSRFSVSFGGISWIWRGKF
jgi:hypothetical protein